MPEIRVLPEKIANQIAAGEVVERPAAAVKELLENSLDSGATRISIEFRNGGKSLIVVEDNGCGMTPDQALMALEMHATSKIRTAEDLNEIHTFGFRGEAVPSIASISRFTLRTRPADALTGTELVVNAGKLVCQRETGMAPGTRVEVANLFHPVPARLKFLKSENTEAAHITRLVRLYAIAQPQTGFTLTEDGREIFSSPAAEELAGRVREIWGGQLAGDLVALAPVESAEMRIWGLLGKPGIGRTTRQEMVTIVNGRPVDSRTLAYALVESYHTLLPKGRYPLAFFFLEIAPHWVDVNVHPAKREIRFRDEARVRQFVISAVMQRLGTLNAGTGASAASSATVVGAEPRARTHDAPSAPPVPAPHVSVGADLRVRPAAPVPVPAAVPVVPAPHEGTGRIACATQEPPAQNYRLNWRLVGRLADGFFLFETDTALVVLNLRAARERIWYERILRRFSENAPIAQQLLLPVPLELEPLAAEILREGRAILAAAGFDIQEFGRNFFRILSVPDWLGNADVLQTVRDIVAALGRQSATLQRENIAHEMLARMAGSKASGAGKAGETLSDEIANATVRDLFLCRQPTVTPAGKPVFFEMTRGEIARRLGA